MPFGPHPSDDPNHGKTVGPVDMVDMVVLAIETLLGIDTCPSVDGDVTKATMLGSHDIGFTWVVAVLHEMLWCVGRGVFCPWWYARFLL
jgi:hypothetical protein